MKTSNMILIGSFFAVLTMCIIILMLIKSVLNGQDSFKKEMRVDSQIAIKNLDLSDFKELSLKGAWHVTMTHGDKASVIVEGGKDLLDDLKITKQGQLLEIHMNQSKDDKRKLNLKVTVPVLQTLLTKGVTEIGISGFDLEKLNIQAEGVTSVKAENGQTKNFVFEGRGVSKLDSKDFPTHHAKIMCEGVVKIDLTMAGGDLSGSIEGVGEVRYQGEAASQTIRVKGQCKVLRTSSR